MYTEKLYLNLSEPGLNLDPNLLNLNLRSRLKVQGKVGLDLEVQV
jgi:hypothetical protein